MIASFHLSTGLIYFIWGRLFLDMPRHKWNKHLELSKCISEKLFSVATGFYFWTCLWLDNVNRLLVWYRMWSWAKPFTFISPSLSTALWDYNWYVNNNPSFSRTTATPWYLQFQLFLHAASLHYVSFFFFFKETSAQVSSVSADSHGKHSGFSFNLRSKCIWSTAPPIRNESPGYFFVSCLFSLD